MQSRLHSLIETVANIAVGFMISVLVWEFIVKPVWGIQTSFAENLSITTLFTVISIIRSYVMRRLGNYFTVRKLKQEQDKHELSGWIRR